MPPKVVPLALTVVVASSVVPSPDRHTPALLPGMAGQTAIHLAHAHEPIPATVPPPDAGQELGPSGDIAAGKLTFTGYPPTMTGFILEA